MPFECDDALAHVLRDIAEHENVHGGIAFYGCTDMGDAITATHAVRDAHDIAADVRAEVARAFRWPGSFFLTGEQSAVLYEALRDYAMGDARCDARDDAHTGYAGEMCDCARRARAHTWVCELAMSTAGVELA